MKDEIQFEGTWTGLNHYCDECCNSNVITTDFMFIEPIGTNWDNLEIPVLDREDYTGFCPDCGKTFQIIASEIPTAVKQYLYDQPQRIYNYNCKINDEPRILQMKYRNKIK